MSGNAEGHASIRPPIADYEEIADSTQLVSGDPDFHETVRRLVGMSLDQFAREGQCLEVKVPWLDVTLWWVPAEADAEALTREGVSRGRIWTAKELMDLSDIDGLTLQAIQTLAQAKMEFGGEVVEVRTRPGDTPERASRSPWPTAIPELGVKTTVPLTQCKLCSAGTWAQYGEWPLCQRCAQQVADRGVRDQPPGGEAA